LHRESRGWSQNKVAQIAGVHVNTYARVENGLPCDPGTAKKIADVFCISTLEFLPETESVYRKRRYLLGLTIKQVAERLGVDEHTIIRYEKGITKPRENIAQEYLNILGLKNISLV